MSINVNVGGNTDPLVRDITAAVDRINKSGRLKIQLDSRGVTQPLGRMTRSADEFTKSLEASNARVLAFGASVGVINAVSQAFKGLVQSTIEVEKNLTDINVVMGLTTRELDKFGGGLMKVAKETGAGFKAASDAATEFARQGLSMAETLKRTSDALILTRLTGMDAAESVKSITAAMNTFGSEVKNSTELVSKFAAVDVKFAVSAGDFAQAISRAGQSAKQAGVDIDTFVGMVTAAQERTARGGAVIGNALKTIFTRVQKPATLKQLESLGIAVRDISGRTMEADKIIGSLAQSWDNLTDAQRASTGQTVAGMFQINILKAVMADMAKQNNVTSEAMKISARATDESTKKNEALRQTMSALAGETGVAVQELAKKIGDIALAPGISQVLDSIKGMAEGMGGLLGDGENEGNKWAKGLLKGVGNMLTGPGLVIFAAVAGKLFFNAFKYAKDSLGSLLNINKAATQRVTLEQSLMQVITKNDHIMKEMLRTDTNREVKQKIITDLIRQQTREAERLSSITRSMSGPMLRMGISPDLTDKRASGYIPNYASPATQEKREAAKGGYVAGKIKQGPGFVYNDKEEWKKFPGLKEPGLLPPQPSEASKKYAEDFSSKHGFDPYAAGGYVPNFAIAIAEKRWTKQNALSVYNSAKKTPEERAAAEEWLAERNHLGEYNTKSSAITVPAAQYQRGQAGKIQAQKVKGAKEFDATSLFTLLALKGSSAVSASVYPGGKGKESIYGLAANQDGVLPRIKFGISGFKKGNIATAKNSKKDNLEIIQDMLLDGAVAKGVEFSNGLNLGDSKNGGPPFRSTPEAMEAALRKGGSGALGALSGLGGALFEAAISTRLPATDIGGGPGRFKHAGGGETRVGGDFDVRDIKNHPLIAALFDPGPIADVGDYKTQSNDETKKSMANKIAKEMIYRRHPDFVGEGDQSGKGVYIDSENSKPMYGREGGAVRGKLKNLSSIKASGFVPNYASKFSTRAYTRGAGMRHTDALIKEPSDPDFTGNMKSYMEYHKEGPSTRHIDYMKSYNKGDAFELFGAASRQKFMKGGGAYTSDKIKQQRSYKQGSGSNWEDLLYAFPQMKYRMQKGMTTSGTITAHMKNRLLNQNFKTIAGLLPVINSLDREEFRETLGNIGAFNGTPGMHKVEITDLYTRLKKGGRGDGKAYGKKAGGFIPNYADPLSNAIGRERGAGVPVSQIRVGTHRKLVGKSNPAGLGVTNTHDEPNGLRDVFGAGQGIVPNFAMGGSIKEMLGIGLDETMSSLNEEMDQLAKELSKFEGTVEYTEQRQQKYGKSVDSAREEVDRLKAEEKSYRDGVRGRKIGSKNHQKVEKQLTIAEDRLKSEELKQGVASRRNTKAKDSLTAAENKLRTNQQSQARVGGRQGRSGMIGMGAMMAMPMLGGMLDPTGSPLNEAGDGASQGHAASSAMTGASTGLMMLGQFGIWGKVIGGVGGALWGLANASNAAAEALEKKRKEDARKEYVKSNAQAGAIVASNMFDLSSMGHSLSSSLDDIDLNLSQEVDRVVTKRIKVARMTTGTRMDYMVHGGGDDNFSPAQVPFGAHGSGLESFAMVFRGLQAIFGKTRQKQTFENENVEVADENAPKVYSPLMSTKPIEKLNKTYEDLVEKELKAVKDSDYRKKLSKQRKKAEEELIKAIEEQSKAMKIGEAALKIAPGGEGFKSAVRLGQENLKSTYKSLVGSSASTDHNVAKMQDALGAQLGEFVRKFARGEFQDLDALRAGVNQASGTGVVPGYQDKSATEAPFQVGSDSMRNTVINAAKDASMGSLELISRVLAEKIKADPTSTVELPPDAEGGRVEKSASAVQGEIDSAIQVLQNWSKTTKLSDEQVTQLNKAMIIASGTLLKWAKQTTDADKARKAVILQLDLDFTKIKLQNQVNQNLESMSRAYKQGAADIVAGERLYGAGMSRVFDAQSKYSKAMNTAQFAFDKKNIEIDKTYRESTITELQKGSFADELKIVLADLGGKYDPKAKTYSGQGKTFNPTGKHKFTPEFLNSLAVETKDGKETEESTKRRSMALAAASSDDLNQLLTLIDESGVGGMEKIKRLLRKNLEIRKESNRANKEGLSLTTALSAQEQAISLLLDKRLSRMEAMERVGARLNKQAENATRIRGQKQTTSALEFDRDAGQGFRGRYSTAVQGHRKAGIQMEASIVNNMSSMTTANRNLIKKAAGEADIPLTESELKELTAKARTEGPNFDLAEALKAKAKSEAGRQAESQKSVMRKHENVARYYLNEKAVAGDIFSPPGLAKGKSLGRTTAKVNDPVTGNLIEPSMSQKKDSLLKHSGSLGMTKEQIDKGWTEVHAAKVAADMAKKKSDDLAAPGNENIQAITDMGLEIKNNLTTEEEVTEELRAQLAVQKELIDAREAHITGPGSAGRGFDKGLGALNDEMKTFRYNLTQSIPKDFSNALGGALHSAIRDGEKLGDTLRKAALGFLDTLNQKFMGHFADQITLSLFGPGKSAALNKGGPVPARLTNGEFVMDRSAVKKYGGGFMDSLNKGKSPVSRQEGGPSLAEFFREPIKGNTVEDAFGEYIKQSRARSFESSYFEARPGPLTGSKRQNLPGIDPMGGVGPGGITLDYLGRTRDAFNNPIKPGGSLAPMPNPSSKAPRGLSPQQFKNIQKLPPLGTPDVSGMPGFEERYADTEDSKKLHSFFSNATSTGIEKGKEQAAGKIKQIGKGQGGGGFFSIFGDLLMLPFKLLGGLFGMKDFNKGGQVKGYEGGGGVQGLGMALGSIALGQLLKEDEEPEHEALRDSWAETRYNKETKQVTGNRPWEKKGRRMSARYMQQNQRVQDYAGALSQQKQAQLDEKLKKFEEKQQLGRGIFSAVASYGLAKAGSHLQETGAFGRADLAMGLGTSGQVKGPGGNMLNVKMSPDGQAFRSKTADIDAHKQIGHIRSAKSFSPGGGMPKWLGGSGSGKYETASRADFKGMLETGAFQQGSDGNFFSATPESGNWGERFGAKPTANEKRGANIFGYKKDDDKSRLGNTLSWMNQQVNPFTWERKNSGGKIAGQPGVDKIPAMLTEGEYVINANAARQIGEPTLNKINSGRFANGGIVSDEPKDRSSGSGADNTNNITITINVDKSGGTSEANVSNEGQGEEGNMNQLSTRIKEQVVTIIKEESRPGGMLDDGK